MDQLRCDAVTSRRDRNAFLDLEKQIYDGDPNWVCPLRMLRREEVGFKHHPFYDDAEREVFLARRGDKVVGRVVAIVNHAHNRRYDEKRGFFGFFESFDDVEASNLLFPTACEWLRAQGMTDVRGPANPSSNYEWGLLVDGFDSPPTFMIPYNRPYYEKLVTEFGFEKTQDMFSYDVHVDLLEDVDPKVVFVIEEAIRRFKVECRPLNRRNFRKDYAAFLRIYNLSLQQNWGYVPMSESEVKHLADGLKYLIVPKLTSIAEIDGEPVGAGFALLDYNQVIRKLGGRLFPFGWLRLLFGRRHIDRLRMISTNVLPEYQKWGLGVVTLYGILPAAIESGIVWGEFSWVLESNALSRGTIERGGAKRTKVHRIYDRSLSDI